ncbi:uncharacterized protein LOC131930845 [Physella acuta]|uniref:uncharacterized protein LOC131930845 n=1 Tax=Physella acuta TaxID=109671 RepID=UPI0027DDE0DC|nr:uncharacterized protein LOC131930845 [Physella acuta]
MHFQKLVDNVTCAFHAEVLKLEKMKNDVSSTFVIVSNHLNSCLKLLKEMRVWPPSVDILFPELTLTCNYLILNTSYKSQGCHLNEFEVECVVSRALSRVYHLGKNPQKTQLLLDCITDVESELSKIIEELKDPFLQFRLVRILGKLLTMCSIFSIYRKLQGDTLKITKMFSLLDSLKDLVDQTVMKEVLPFKHNLLLCEQPPSDEDKQFPCVVDVLQLVLSACFGHTNDSCLQYKKWEWLNTVLICEKLKTEEKVSQAICRIQTCLSAPLDPEHKSKILCMLAKCYLQLGYFQLSIQTCKEALNVYNKNLYIFELLVKVYQLLGLEELELESLNLLVQILMDNYLRYQPSISTVGLDDAIILVCKILPDPCLIATMHKFAKRCFDLQRYKEAAEQYQALMKFLEKTETLSNKLYKICTQKYSGVCDIVVETAEALAMAQHYDECIVLCDRFHNTFTTDDTFSKLSFNAAKKVHPGNSSNAASPDLPYSQDSLFSTSQDADLLESQPDSEKDTFFKDQTLFLTTKLASRKRLRHSSGDREQLGEKSSSKDTEEFHFQMLNTRLMLSKADSLVANQGYSDEMMGCLLKAYNLLVNLQVSIFNTEAEPNNSCINKPVLKRRCLNLDYMDSHTSLLSENKSHSSSDVDMDKWTPTAEWSKLIILVALRIAKAALERKQISSVLNVCKLILELEPHNLSAHYYRILVMRNNSRLKEKFSEEWLQERCIEKCKLENQYKTMMEEMDMKIKRQLKEEQICYWWQPREAKLLAMDIACINDLYNKFKK